MQYCRANKLNQTAKWLGELLVKVQLPESTLIDQTLKKKVILKNKVSTIDDQIM